MRLKTVIVGLTGLGLISLGVARAEEKPANNLMTAVTGTTIDGYVDTSAHWNFGTGNAPASPPYKFNSASKSDGFNLNVVQLRIEKPLDESDWAAGYRADLWFGPDANTLGTTSIGGGTSSDFAIRQAYVALHTPVGKGLDFRMGVFDSILGYESVEGPANPNYTRSYGHSIEPQTHTGLLAIYHVNENIAIKAGVANTLNATINDRAQLHPTGAGGQGYNSESYKTYMGAISLTAPESMGALAGSTLYGGVVNGFDTKGIGGVAAGVPHLSAYAGLTLATPIKKLRVGLSFDEAAVDTHIDSTRLQGDAWAVAAYCSFQATEKFSIHNRFEYVEAHAEQPSPGFPTARIMAETIDLQYDLWANVLTRLEFRWDHSLNDADIFGIPGVSGNQDNNYLLALNVVYKF